MAIVIYNDMLVTGNREIVIYYGAIFSSNKVIVIYSDRLDFGNQAIVIYSGMIFNGNKAIIICCIRILIGCIHPLPAHDDKYLAAIRR